MRSLPRSLLALLLLALSAVLAGCVASEDTPSENAAAGANNTTAVTNTTAETVLYTFSDNVVGASNPHAKDVGVDQIPLAKVERFTVPEGTANLSFTGEVATGTGDGRIEVYDPAGKLVYMTNTWLIVGVPGFLGVGVYNPTEETVKGPAAPGDYEVRYYVSGAMGAVLEVSGLTPA
ncbi:MAG TPA: hypothetical protein VNZ52_10815 [Candidatus Thermoplasmatota archaeon]|nr:hypothetical protein [Candidatus Thermoplasmatota archaeon]